ncbi:hypothetical protein [Labilibaculum euxinus]
MKKFKNSILKNYEMVAINGGYRSVVRTDRDGDGNWDKKEVYVDGKLKKVVYR